MVRSREEKGASTAATIAPEQAWTIAHRFAREAGEQLRDHVRAVVVIGSPATEAYRPGRGDIDTAIIVRDTTPPTHHVQALAQRYRRWPGGEANCCNGAVTAVAPGVRRPSGTGGRGAGRGGSARRGGARGARGGR